MNFRNMFGWAFGRESGGGSSGEGFASPSGTPEPDREEAKAPVDAIADPLRNLTVETVEQDFRLRVLRGEFVLPSWALYMALRAESAIGAYERIWCSRISARDWTIAITKAGRAEENRERAEKQKAELLRFYERQPMKAIFAHLARADLYGFAILILRGDQLEILDPWTISREGLRGDCYWNPSSRPVYLVRGGLIPAGLHRIEAEDMILRETENPVGAEYLRLYLAAKENAGYWDEYNERRSHNQVVVLTGSVEASKREEFISAARNISRGRSGFLSKGSGETQTEVTYPPGTNDPTTFANRLTEIEHKACRALFGADLQSLATAGSGTLAGGAHSDTASARVMGAAGEIAEAIQVRVDRKILLAADLLAEGEESFAYFTLSDIVDPKAEGDLSSTLANAGFVRDPEELGERLGMTLELRGGADQNERARDPLAILPRSAPTSPSLAPVPAAAPPPDLAAASLNGAQLSSILEVVRGVSEGAIPPSTASAIIAVAFPSITADQIGSIVSPLSSFTPKAPAAPPPDALANADPAALRATLLSRIGSKRIEGWAAPLKKQIAELLADLEKGDLTPERLDALEVAIEALSPADLDEEALARSLSSVLAAAAVEGVKAAPAKPKAKARGKAGKA